jgi:hypothetical protein
MTREEQVAALLVEAHAILDRHVRDRIAYYSSPDEVSRELLDRQHVSDVALDEIIGAIARQLNDPFNNLREATQTQKSCLVVDLLEDVLLRVDPRQSEVATAA